MNNLNNYTNPAPLEGTYRIADPSKRLVAYLIDVAVVGVLSFVFGILSGIFILFGGFGPLLAVGIWLVYIVGLLLFYIRYWKNSTSFGKSMMKMKVVTKDGHANLGLGNMVLREIIGKMISGAAMSLGYIWILIDADKQGFHDKLVSSVVVVVE